MLDDPGWDKTMVQNTVDVVLLLEQLASAMEQVPGVAGVETDEQAENLFTKGARLFRAIRRNWEGKIGNSSGATIDEVPFEGSPLSFSDYMWLPDSLYPSAF